jgi:hypothetical protein
LKKREVLARLLKLLLMRLFHLIVALALVVVVAVLVVVVALALVVVVAVLVLVAALALVAAAVEIKKRVFESEVEVQVFVGNINALLNARGWVFEMKSIATTVLLELAVFALFQFVVVDLVFQMSIPILLFRVLSLLFLLFLLTRLLLLLILLLFLLTLLFLMFLLFLLFLMFLIPSL